MNNSFGRLIDGMCATLRSEVLTRLDDEFARGQVFGVINLLNTFKVRADWSAGFLLEQIAAQRTALDAVTALLQGQAAAGSLPVLPAGGVPKPVPIVELLAQRRGGNPRNRRAARLARRAAAGADSRAGERRRGEAAHGHAGRARHRAQERAAALVRRDVERLGRLSRPPQIGGCACTCSYWAKPLPTPYSTMP